MIKQKKHWTRGHKEECNMMKAVQPRVPTRSILYLVRLLNRLNLLDEKGSETKDNPLLQQVLDLCDHKEDMSMDETLSYGYVARMTHLFLNGRLPPPPSKRTKQEGDHNIDGDERREEEEEGEEGEEGSMSLDQVLDVPPEDLGKIKGPGPALIFSLLHKLSINSFNISDGEITQGVGLFLKSSLINHDCDPNCAASFIFPDPSLKNARILASLRGSGDIYGSNGPLDLFIEIRSLRPIRKGESISISYVDRLVPPSQRRLILSESFFFHCNCALCSDPIRSIAHDQLLVGYKTVCVLSFSPSLPLSLLLTHREADQSPRRSQRLFFCLSF